MTTKEAEFIAEIKAVMAKYGVTAERDIAYYPDEERTVRFSVEGGVTSISEDDLFDIK